MVSQGALLRKATERDSVSPLSQESPYRGNFTFNMLSHNQKAYLISPLIGSYAYP
jgi:hypothetical protein